MWTRISPRGSVGKVVEEFCGVLSQVIIELASLTRSGYLYLSASPITIYTFSKRINTLRSVDIDLGKGSKTNFSKISHVSCRNNASFRLNSLGPLCLWKCLNKDVIKTKCHGIQTEGGSEAHTKIKMARIFLPMYMQMTLVFDTFFTENVKRAEHHGQLGRGCWGGELLVHQPLPN